MNTNKKTARVAGFLYLLVVIFSVFTLEYVPGKVIVWDNPTATANNILTSGMLFRLGIVISILGHISFILLSLVLYKLLKTVNKRYALLMVILVLLSIPISYSLVIKEFDILQLATRSKYLEAFSASQIQAQIMFAFESYDNGLIISQIFWGLWLFPFGYLVFKSGFLPKILGILLMLGCFSYLFDSIGRTLFTNYYDFINSRMILLPASLGEIGSCLWLLIMGAKEKPAAVPFDISKLQVS